MKAGIVIMAEALAAARHPADVAVLLTSDEETGSTTSRGLIEREAARAGSVLVLEPSLAGAVKIARRGGSMYRVEVHGRAAHAGLEPAKGRSALTELAHQVLALPALADDDLGTTVNPTVAHAGTATNVIPERAELQDRRAGVDDGELERVDAAMQALDGTHPRCRGHHRRRNQPPADGAQPRPSSCWRSPGAVRRGSVSRPRRGVGGRCIGRQLHRRSRVRERSTGWARTAPVPTPWTSGCLSRRC